jgi:hypothetical protein
VTKAPSPSQQIPGHIVELFQLRESHSQKAERIFLSCTPAVFKNDLKAWSEIKKRIANHLRIPKHSVLACGSAMIGYSFIKERAFDAKTSDLDIAIVNSELFIRCIEETFVSTNSLTDETTFTRIAGQNSANLYKEALAKGRIYTKHLPQKAFRKNFDHLLRQATQTHAHLFNEITCAIYASEKLFIEKQTKIVELAGAL